MKKVATMAIVAVAFGIVGCADMAGTTSASSPAAVSTGGGYAYPSATSTTGSGNAYNWMEGGGG